MVKSKKQNQPVFQGMDKKTILFVLICAGFSILMSFLGRSAFWIHMFNLEDVQQIMIISSLINFVLTFLKAFPFFFLGLAFGLRPLYLSGSIAFFLFPLFWLIDRTFSHFQWAGFTNFDWKVHLANFDWVLFAAIYYFIFSVLAPIILVTQALNTSSREQTGRSTLKSPLMVMVLLMVIASLYDVGINYIPFGQFNSWFDVYVISYTFMSNIFWALNMLLCFFVAQWIVVKLKWNVCPPISIFLR